MRVTFGLRLDERQGPSSQDFFMAPQVGRQGFLGLLETYLGLSAPAIAQAERVTAYLGLLTRAEGEGPRFYSASLMADSVGSAATLLEWRDEWYLSGWDGRVSNDSPRKLRDLAAVEAMAAGTMAPGEGERLAAVAQALRAKNKIPVTSVQLVDDLALIPQAWRVVLALLPVEALPELTPSAAGDLGRLQAATLTSLRAGRVSEAIELKGDLTFEVVQANSRELAEHWLSATCRAKPADRLILCEDGGDALDSTLEATGVPACGFGAASELRPALQALGLALETCWTPIDVPRVVEFLVHPIGPFTAKARRPLAKALATQPGIGSDSWVAAKDSLKDLEHAKEVLEDVDFWFEGARWDRAEGAPLLELSARTDRVYQALKRLAGAAEADELGLGSALSQCEAVQAGLAEFEQQGVPCLRARQIEQLLSQATPGGAINPYAASQAGCLKSAAVAAVCGTEQSAEVIWWMPSTPALPRPHPWSTAEVAALGEQGVQLRDPAAELASLSRQWLRPLLAAKERFILVLPPAGGEEHPIWQLIKQISPAVKVRRIDHELHGAQKASGLAPVLTNVALVTAPHFIELGGPISSRRKEQSFTSLNDFFNNPALAVLKDVAGLRTGTVLEASAGNRLLGTLAHRVVEKLFAEEAVLAWTAEQAETWFDAMVDPLLQAEGAPLLMSGASVELHRFKQTCRRALGSLLGHLRNAGAVRVQTETEIKGSFAGEPFIAVLDLLVTLSTGRTVVLDLKWGWASHHRERLQAGRHLQLALYAGLVRETLGSLPITVGYFIFQGAELIVSHEGVFGSAEVRAPKSGITLPELYTMALATWQWRQDQWAKGTVEWVDKRFGKLTEMAGPEGTLVLDEDVGYFDGDYLALLGGWEK